MGGHPLQHPMGDISGRSIHTTEYKYKGRSPGGLSTLLIVNVTPTVFKITNTMNDFRDNMVARSSRNIQSIIPTPPPIRPSKTTDRCPMYAELLALENNTIMRSSTQALEEPPKPPKPIIAIMSGSMSSAARASFSFSSFFLCFLSRFSALRASSSELSRSIRVSKSSSCPAVICFRLFEANLFFTWSSVERSTLIDIPNTL
mmetsp:Transcript_9255/g.10694  ORF Transcript_9255/g.10694 Transcript_9255/m.10694 type:complete len:202 (+) Transcript_9255:687-1292(+)